MPPTRFVLLAFALSIAACGERSGTTAAGGSSNTAKVRLVNATSVPLDVLDNGAVVSGASGVASLASSACVNVNVDLSRLSVRQSGTTTTLPGFAPVFVTGGTYTVVAYPNRNGAILFATLVGNFTPASGQAGLAVFNGAPTTASYDLYVTAPGAQLGSPAATNLGLGSGTAFLNVSAGSNQIRFTNFGTATVAFDAGSYTFTAGQSRVSVLAAPNAALAGVTVPVC